MNSRTKFMIFLQSMSNNTNTKDVHHLSDKPSGLEAVKVIRPKLSEAAMAKWKRGPINSIDLPPITIRPKLRCSVTVPPSGKGKIITILDGDSDSD